MGVDGRLQSAGWNVDPSKLPAVDVAVDEGTDAAADENSDAYGRDSMEDVEDGGVVECADVVRWEAGVEGAGMPDIEDDGGADINSAAAAVLGEDMVADSKGSSVTNVNEAGSATVGTV